MDRIGASSTALTQLLAMWRDGDEAAFARLMEQVYPQLKQIAAQRIHQVSDQDITPTELLHDSVLRLIDVPTDWQSRAHFFATASLVIRSTLVDHARARAAAKRGGGEIRVTLTLTRFDADIAEESAVTDVLALDQALIKLASLDARAAEVLHLTYFAGLDRRQAAEVLRVSPSTVDRELRFARAWLGRELDHDG